MKKYSIIYSDDYGNKIVKRDEWCGSKKSLLQVARSYFTQDELNTLRGDLYVKIQGGGW